MNLSTIPNMNPMAVSPAQDRMKLEILLARKSMVEFIERYKWSGLPKELSQDLIERLLWFRGKGCLFKAENDGKYRFLPFTLNGDIDIYGRYMNITPTLFTGTEAYDKQPYITNLSLPVAYSVDDKDGKAVILTDSSLAIAQDNPFMNDLIKPINEQLVDILVLVNIDLISSAKVFYLMAQDEAQKTAIEAEFANMDNQILNGKRAFVVVSPTELKEITKETSKDSARYFQSYQSFDNLRKDILGIPNGGTFMKQEHMTEAESSQNGNSASSVFNNGLRVRKEFCEIANAVFGLSISVEGEQMEPTQVVEEPGSQTNQADEQGGE